MLSVAEAELQKKCRELWREAQELTLIFSAIVKSTKSK